MAEIEPTAGHECNYVKQIPSPIADANPGDASHFSRVRVARETMARRRREDFRRLQYDVVTVMSTVEDQKDANQQVVGLIRAATGVDAVGLRLQDGQDFPYLCQEGFSHDFLEMENSLLIKTADGGICRDENGEICLECTCGLVISGKIDPQDRHRTPRGSLWVNDASLGSLPPPEEDPRVNPRNECLHRGYASIALIPVRAKERIIGLLQLNHREMGAFTSEGIEALEEVAHCIGAAVLRRITDEKLLASERFLRMLTENLPAMISYWTGELRCSFANRSYLEWHGKSSDQMMGIFLPELLGEERFRSVEPRVRAALAGEPQQFESEVENAGGETARTWTHYVPDKVGDTVSGFFVLISDVTQLKRAEEGLQASLALNRQIIECAQEGIVVHDRELRYWAWNPFLEQMTGISANEIVGRYPWDLFPALKQTGALMQLEKALHGEPVPGEEFFFSNEKTGRTGWTYNTAAPLRNDDGEIIGVIRTISDVTERKKLEEQLRHSQRMEALGQLAGGVAHDFNNVLQIIMGYAALAEMQAPPKLQEPLKEIVAAAERAAELTSGLLSYSRKQIFKLEPVDLNKLVTTVEKFLIRVVGEDIHFELNESPVPLVATVDKAHLQQVFVNLASNARDAMPGGGRLSISLRDFAIDGNFVRQNGFGAPGEYALITVSDTGEGIPQEYQHKIFEPFFTTKPEGQGTGLGLSIVYGIVSQLQGFIICSSQPGEGTTFRIYLPLGGALQKSAEPAVPSSGLAPGTVTLLLVEDDPDVRKVTAELLETAGFQVVEARDGRDAVRIFEANHARIQLVVLDALMPGMNGAETLAALQEIVPGVKALFLSGYPQHIISGKMAIPEGVAFIDKPVFPARLLEGVSKALGR